jgi:quercetin dioxygenase-like cupin family protein
MSSNSSVEQIRQPECNFEFHGNDDVFIKQMVVPDRGTVVPQHSHEYDHTSMLAKGSVKVWGDGKYLGVFVSPAGIEIKAGVKHSFLTLEDDTIIYCIHNVSRSGGIEMLEEHQLGE